MNDDNKQASAGAPTLVAPNLFGRTAPYPKEVQQLVEEWKRNFQSTSATPTATPTPPPPLPSLLNDATTLISGPRRDAYGPVRKSFERAAKVWSALLGVPVSAEQVALLMAAFKLCREAHAPGRDNRVDAVGYLALLEELHVSATYGASTTPAPLP